MNGLKSCRRILSHQINIDRETGLFSTTRQATRLMAVMLFIGSLSVPAARAADKDTRLWVPVQLINPYSDAWTVSMHTELRWQDNLSEFGDLILSPAIHYHPGKSWHLSAGYKYHEKYESSSDEQDIYQEFSFNKKRGDLVTGYQLRMEQRFIDNISGVIHRLRFLTHASHPIREGPHYLFGHVSAFFNLNDKGEGPVHGFEQSRVYFGFGRHIGSHIAIEAGYLWGYKSKRNGDDLSAHIIQLGLSYNTRGKAAPLKPNVRDSFR